MECLEPRMIVVHWYAAILVHCSGSWMLRKPRYPLRVGVQGKLDAGVAGLARIKNKSCGLGGMWRILDAKKKRGLDLEIEREILLEREKRDKDLCIQKGERDRKKYMFVEGVLIYINKGRGGGDI